MVEKIFLFLFLFDTIYIRIDSKEVLEMQNDIKEKLKFIYDELDLYKGAIVAGEKVELIITPREENGKYIPNERVITIGLQNGFSRDRVSFVVPNGEYFDDVLLPNILDYYSKNDKYDSDWSISQRTLPLQTNKAILETENGNLLYLETLDDNLFLNLQNRKEREKEEIQTETFSLTMEQLEWQKIIEYAKSRIVPKDAWEDVLSEDERKNRTSCSKPNYI